MLRIEPWPHGHVEVPCFPLALEVDMPLRLSGNGRCSGSRDAGLALEGLGGMV